MVVINNKRFSDDALSSFQRQRTVGVDIPGYSMIASLAASYADASMSSGKISQSTSHDTVWIAELCSFTHIEQDLLISGVNTSGEITIYSLANYMLLFKDPHTPPYVKCLSLSLFYFIVYRMYLTQNLTYTARPYEPRDSLQMYQKFAPSGLALCISIYK